MCTIGNAGVKWGVSYGEHILSTGRSAWLPTSGRNCRTGCGLVRNPFAIRNDRPARAPCSQASPRGFEVAKTDLAEAPAGTELFDTQEKVFPDVKAEQGEKAYTFMHTVPYEGSVGLVNLLTTTRLVRK